MFARASASLREMKESNECFAKDLLIFKLTSIDLNIKYSVFSFSGNSSKN